MNDNNNETGMSIKSFTEALFTSELKDISIDVSELALDSLFRDNSVLREIPIVKTAIAILKVGGTIQQKFDFQKQLAFLSQLQKGNVDPNEIRRRNTAYYNHEVWFQREVENLVIYLSRYASVNKAKIQAVLYMDLLNKRIEQPFFEECLDILDRIFLCDLPHLMDIYKAQTEAGVSLSDLSYFQRKPGFPFQSIRCGRLVSLGLLHQLHPMSFGFSIDNHYLITETGKYFCKLILDRDLVLIS